jgi:hypothetical protein
MTARIRLITRAPAAGPGPSVVPQVTDAPSPPVSAHRALAYGILSQPSARDRAVQIPLRVYFCLRDPRVLENQPAVLRFSVQTSGFF